MAVESGPCCNSYCSAERQNCVFSETWEITVQSPKLEQLRQVWKNACKDRYAQRALGKLKRDGFDITRLSPRDATLRSPTWADYIAALPFLPNRPTRRQLHHRAEQHQTLACCDDPVGPSIERRSPTATSVQNICVLPLYASARRLVVPWAVDKQRQLGVCQRRKK